MGENTAYQHVKDRDVLNWMGMVLADLTFSTTMQLLMLLQASAMAFIPTIGPILCFIYTCWITSLYCFEYSWISAGWSLQKRVTYFEEHWAYFLGFGLAYTTATYFLSFLVSTGTFALLFPFLLIIATSAEPTAHDDTTTIAILLPGRIAICWPTRPLTHRVLLRLIPSKRIKQQMAHI